MSLVATGNLIKENPIKDKKKRVENSQNIKTQLMKLSSVKGELEGIGLKLKKLQMQRNFTLTDASAGRSCICNKGPLGGFSSPFCLNVLFVTSYGDMRWQGGCVELIGTSYDGGAIY